MGAFYGSIKFPHAAEWHVAINYCIIVKNNKLPDSPFRGENFCFLVSVKEDGVLRN